MVSENERMGMSQKKPVALLKLPSTPPGLRTPCTKVAVPAPQMQTSIAVSVTTARTAMATERKPTKRMQKMTAAVTPTSVPKRS